MALIHGPNCKTRLTHSQMKTAARFLALFSVSVWTNSSALKAESNQAVEAFPHRIAFENGAAEFAAGDAIIVRSVRGDRPVFELGGSYEVEGSYTLASTDKARLGFSVTSRGPSGRTPVAREEWMMVERGSGTFRFVKTFLKEGWPHVSFWVNGTSHGGIYFGDGINQTTLRSKSWSDFNKSGTPGRTAHGGRFETATLHPVNAAILKYLGDPVPAPRELDARFASDGLENAFRTLCANASIQVRKLVIDTSEFPYLIYGILEGTHTYTAIRALIPTAAGYAYAGSVTRRLPDGSTSLSINLTPLDRLPLENRAAIQRRLLVRLEMLAENAVAKGTAKD